MLLEKNTFISQILMILLLTALLVSCQSSGTQTTETKADMEKKVDYALVIHGGAGTITKKNMTPEREEAYRNILDEVLEKGKAVLASGGRSQEAVIACISIMEDSPLFNAGKGSVFTHDGTNEMDASIMRGRDLQAGAVGGLTRVKNPIKAAYAVLDSSEHVFLIGKGAEEFADEQGIEMVEPDYFYTDRRWKSLERILEKEAEIGMHITDMADSKYGTVGVVALDRNGDIVAGTSTGGMTNKKYDRIGDSPIIGAGTYANNGTCGVSSTGHGEFFIRYAVAYDISALMEYKGWSLDKAADHVIMEKLKNAGGGGGVVALDRYGNIAMPFNTEGMYRGYVTDKEKYIGIYKED